MELIADILLVAGALGAGLYCFVLAKRLKRFTDLEKGVGGAVSVLSVQAEQLKKSLDAARLASDHSGQQLRELTERAESVAQRLELIMASMHDIIPDEPPAPEKPIATEATDFQAASGGPDEALSAKVSTGTETRKSQHGLTEEDSTPRGVLFLRHTARQTQAKP